jgi:hypothetical protein
MRAARERCGDVGDRARQRLEAEVEAPERSILLLDLVGDRPHLDRRYARERRGMEHAEALHRLHVAAVRAIDVGARADRGNVCVGEHRSNRRQEHRIGVQLARDERRASVAVEGAFADHDRAGRQSRGAARTGDAHVQHRIGAWFAREACCGRGGRVDRSHAAGEHLDVEPFGAVQFGLGGGDDQQHRCVSA